MSDDIDVLWNLYKDNIEQGRLHEGFRATMLQISLAISAAVLTRSPRGRHQGHTASRP